MSAHNDGGPAFPGQWYDRDSTGEQVVRESYCGMTLRDKFAEAALVGWLSGPCAGDVLNEYDSDWQAFAEHQAAVARTCYGYADAMLKAREPQP